MRKVAIIVALAAVLIASPPPGTLLVQGPTPGNSPQTPEKGAALLSEASWALGLGSGPASGHAVSCTSAGTLSDRCDIRSSPTTGHPASSSGWKRVCAYDSCPPPARGGAAMSYDPSCGCVIMVGGLNISTEVRFADTWQFKGGAWTILESYANGPNSTSDTCYRYSNGINDSTTTPCPAARLAASMVYDAADGYLVFFGGGNINFGNFADSFYFGDTWTYSNGTWANITGGAAPSPRAFVGMTYDPVDGYVLLFGGMDNFSTAFSDTWSFHAGMWTLLHPAVSPVGVMGPGLAFDEGDGYALLFGGARVAPGYTYGLEVNYTWTFVGGVWTNISASIPTPPGSRRIAAMAYDPAQGYMLLWGGWDLSQGLTSVYPDTWEFSQGAWFELTPSPAPYQALFASSLAQLGPASGLLLFGGAPSLNATTNTTWTYGPLPPAPRVPFSIGVIDAPGVCAGPSIDGKEYPNGTTAQLLPGNYNVSAMSCSGHVFRGWYPSGGVSVASPLKGVTQIHVTANGTLTVYYAIPGSVSYQPELLGVGITLILLAATVVLVYVRHRPGTGPRPD